MHTGVDLHVYHKIANAPVLPFPFPHMVRNASAPAPKPTAGSPV